MIKLLALLLILTACQSDRKEDNSIYVDVDSVDAIRVAPTYDSGAFSGAVFADPYGTYCCDTVRTLNHTAIVQSIIDTSGVLIDFEIVKVLK